MVPSPKFQDHDVGLLEDVSEKDIVCPVVGEVGVKVKVAIGAFGFTTMLLLTVLDPPALVAVSDTV